MFEITILSSPGCGGCIATARSMDRYGIDHLYRDVTEDPAAHALAVELGYQTTPVIVVRQHGRIIDTWNAYLPGKIRELASRISEA